MGFFSTLVKLEALNIGNCTTITHIGLSSVKYLALTELNISGIECDDSYLAVISEMGIICKLDIGRYPGCNDDLITDRGLSHLSSFRHLTYLSMVLSNSVSHVGMESIKNLPIQDLTIGDTDPGAGLDYYLPYIGTFVELRQLDLQPYLFFKGEPTGTFATANGFSHLGT